MAQILVIEDDQPLRRAWRLVLEQAGHTVLEAGDGRKGLETFKAQPIDLVITDLIMPEMEGVETIQELRRLSPQLKIIAITGGGRGSPANYLRLAKYSGAALTFAKPIEIETLCGAVAQLLGPPPSSPPAVRG